MARRRRRRQNHQIEMLLGVVLVLAIALPIINALIGAVSPYLMPILVGIALIGLAAWALKLLFKYLEQKQRMLLQANQMAIERSVRLFKTMDPVDFEVHISKLFQHKGYRVELTPRSNDKGIDIILRKNGEISVVQVKRYQGNVSSNEVREFLGSMPFVKDCKRGIFVTTGGFSKEAAAAGEQAGLTLIDGAGLEKLWNEVFPLEKHFRT